jgi:hypothetical protein
MITADIDRALGGASTGAYHQGGTRATRCLAQTT